MHEGGRSQAGVHSTKTSVVIPVLGILRILGNSNIVSEYRLLENNAEIKTNKQKTQTYLGMQGCHAT